MKKLEDSSGIKAFFESRFSTRRVKQMVISLTMSPSKGWGKYSIRKIALMKGKKLKSKPFYS